MRSLVHGGAPDVEGGLYAAGHRPEGASLLLKKLLETPYARGAGGRGRPRLASSAAG
jgi:hypothetical protein